MILALTRGFFQLKKLKNQNKKNDTWHNMSLTRVHFFFK